MELFIVDAFTDHIFGGNQAGVVLLTVDESYPDDIVMQKIAAELKHSETAFVKATGADSFQLRYFTPEGEVDLCGHATISAFTVLREESGISAGAYTAQTLARDLRVTVEADSVWLCMPQGEFVRYLEREESDLLYSAYQVLSSVCPKNMQPCIVHVGLSDILLPVGSKEQLDHATQNRAEIIRISRELDVVGVHMFYCPADSQSTAYCRNFAPLFSIDEESATGTSNASLTYYLNKIGLISTESTNTFLQGEAMGKPSVICSKTDSAGNITIGGHAVISVKGKINI